MMAKSSESFPARTRLYSAGTTRRFVRSPPAPKIVRIAGGARWPDRLFATVAAAAASIVVTAGAPGRYDISGAVLRRPGRACLLGPCWLSSTSLADAILSANAVLFQSQPCDACSRCSMKVTSTYTILVGQFDTDERLMGPRAELIAAQFEPREALV